MCLKPKGRIKCFWVNVFIHFYDTSLNKLTTDFDSQKLRLKNNLNRKDWNTIQQIFCFSDELFADTSKNKIPILEINK